MSKITRTLTAAILLALPAAVSATPIFVEYESRIASCSDCAGSGVAVGDRFDGWLRIDTDLAPPDRFGDNPGSSAQYWQPGRDFIAGLGWPAKEFSNDEVGVIDDLGRNSFQGYSLWNYSFNPQGGGTIFELHVSTQDRLDDFIRGKGLEQSFDTADMDGDVRFLGRVTHKLKNMARGIELALERVSVTPGQCRAP
jgi:hypothetical protein